MPQALHNSESQIPSGFQALHLLPNFGELVLPLVPCAFNFGLGILNFRMYDSIQNPKSKILPPPAPSSKYLLYTTEFW
ncbi:hypothetical protein CLI64_14895 [Nostoc sp. CENA543]|nr:hypothetical protein CLI64_14895 [Nostoc sp. CENA543]